jgi:hypothetical protein
MGSSPSSELAVLFEAASDFARAAEYCRLAAQRAAQLFASQETVVRARRGVALLQWRENIEDSAEWWEVAGGQGVFAGA